MFGGDPETTPERYTAESAYACAGETGRFWFGRGIDEGFRRVLNSSRTMTREMLIQWLEHEVENAR